MSRHRRFLLFLVLGIACLIVAGISLRSGAVTVTWWDMLGGNGGVGPAVFQSLRLPRVAMGFLCGGMLGLCGAAMQGLFRNPLADPALIGVSGGAALGAVVAIVLGGSTVFVLPFSAFAGALASALLVHLIARSGGGMVSTLLLAGIAVNAATGAGIGWMVYGASDHQLRDFTFWSLGSLAGTSGAILGTCALFVGVSSFMLFARAGALNGLSLGEADAWHLGIQVERVKLQLLAASALGVGAATAFTGAIGFIGLVAPHVVRLAAGADHRVVLPASFLTGGMLLMAADLLSRILRAPAEIPVGVVVATVGAPFFLGLLLKEQRM